MAEHGRIACCGAVSQYDGAAPAHGPRGVPGLIVTRRLTLTGFVVMDFDDERETALADLKSWVESGDSRCARTSSRASKTSPRPWSAFWPGDNVGKRMVKVV